MLTDMVIFRHITGNEGVFMDQNQRPHSRRKTVGTGSAGVNLGHGTGGSSPVGSGGRKGSSTGGARRAGGKLSLKSILIIAVIAIIAMAVLKGTGGSSLLSSNLLGGSSPLSDTSGSYTSDDYSVYKSPDYTVSKLAREKRYTPVGNGNDTVTIMVYMCGTDLESKYGMATADLKEMINANIAKNVNIIVETGGCKKWKNSSISSTYNQIYKVESKGLKKLENNAGTAAMTDPNNLTTFIKYCEKNYPADRNILIFWDHGGGSLTGFGYDEKKANSSSMTLSKINSALKKADCEFDFIGFDACLMATLETALVCNGYADYMVASEESEPGTGWYYTNWLTKLSENTSVSTVDLGQTIVDDFVAASKSAAPSAQVTLSLVDLAELEGTVPESFRDFSTSTTEMIKSDNYKAVSDARSGARQFAQASRINQVDLIDLALRLGTSESKDLAKALHGCVKYNKSTISRSNGLSIYFPYETTSSVKSAVASYEDIGVDDEYSECIKSFASLEFGGQLASSASQIPDLTSLLGGLTGGTGSSSGSDMMGDLVGSLLTSYIGGSSSSSSSSPLGSILGSVIGGGSSSSSSSPLGALLGSFTGSSGSSSAGSSLSGELVSTLLTSLTGRSMPAELDWVDTDLISSKAQTIAKDFVDPARITATEKDGKSVLDLEDDEWALIQSVELNVFVKEGNGYVDLGLDNTFDWYKNSLLLDWDGTWLTLNGNLCAYYLVSDTEVAKDSWVTVGRIPAYLNGQLVDLQVVFDDEHPEGTITGATPIYEDERIDVQAKGDIEVKAGDKIQLVCDYYNLDGSFNDTYTLGKTFKVPESGLKLENLKVDADEITYTYRITDIYGNHYWLPVEG